MIGRLSALDLPPLDAPDAAAPGFHDLLVETVLGASSDPEDEMMVIAPPPPLPFSPIVVHHEETPAPAARPSDSTEPHELPIAENHVHLVLDDLGERLVITVAVRGSDVHVSLRTPAETASAVARNSGALDHALRASGLDLVELDVASDEPDSEEEEP